MLFSPPCHTRPITVVWHRALVAVFSAMIAATAMAEKPNIVLILTDDLGYGDVTHLNPESKVQTPHMDALANQGVYFTDAHSPSALCSPSRYSILTGHYPWRHPQLMKGIVLPWGKPVIDAGDTTMPAFLAKAGYHTACIGKWHLGFDWPFRDGSNAENTRKGGNSTATPENFDFTRPINGGPLGAGFQHFFGVDCPNFPPYTFINDRSLVGDITQVSCKSLKSLGELGHIHGDGPGAADYQFEKVMPTLTRKAVDYIDAHSQDGQPFFLYFTTTSPHTPVVPAPGFQGQSKASHYGDYVAQTDDAIGQIIAALKKNDCFDNTLLIVSSDNGPSPRTQHLIRKHHHFPAGRLRGMKFDSWEGGHRVPFIASWPNGGIRGGGKITDPIILTDLYATLAAVAEVKLDSPRDSVNLLKSLRGEGPVRREMVYHNGRGGLGMRSGDWVLLVGRAAGLSSAEPEWRRKLLDIRSPDADLQLFNLATDLSQRENIADQHPEKVAQLKTRLNEIRNSRP
ncbi:MAG: arylsulfatase [Akkermansiaceae bacterium]|nr:arylsulfatase [Akkermansiaceae bacterium]